MANRGHVRYSDNVRVELEWVDGAAPSPSEKPGAYRVHISADRLEECRYSDEKTHVRESVGRPFYLYGWSKASSLSDVDAAAIAAIDAALADEEMRGKLDPAFVMVAGVRATTVSPFPSELKGDRGAELNTRGLVECAQAIRLAMPVGPFTRLKGPADSVERACVDAAAHLKNKLQPAMLLLGGFEEADPAFLEPERFRRDAHEALESLRAIQKFAEALGGKGGA